VRSGGDLEAGGTFRGVGRRSLFPVLAGDPALRFLSTVSGFKPANFVALLDLVRDKRWGGINPVVVLSSESGKELDAPLIEARFRPESASCERR
jgi:hypothetical protein